MSNFEKWFKYEFAIHIEHNASFGKTGKLFSLKDLEKAFEHAYENGYDEGYEDGIHGGEDEDDYEERTDKGNDNE